MLIWSRSNTFECQTKFWRRYERNNKTNINKAIREVVEVIARGETPVVVTEDVDKAEVEEVGAEAEAEVGLMMTEVQGVATMDGAIVEV